MGTTCSLILLCEPPGGLRGFIGHVGDSRIYLVRAGQTHQLTEDHSLVNELVRRGKLKREDIDHSPYKQYKNAVTRAVGVYESVEVETFDLDVLPGDDFLLCTDGLYAYLGDKELPGLLGADKVNEIPKALIGLANEGGGHDNITAVVVRVPDDKPAAIDTRAEEFQLKLEVLKGMPLFRYLTYTELVRVMNITEMREVAAGEAVLREGESGTEMYVLLAGTVRLHQDDAVITILGKGDHFGEMGLVDRTPRSLSATVIEDCRLLVIKRADFYDIVRKEPSLSVKLLWSFVQVLAERLRKTTADLSGARMIEKAEDLSDEVLFDE